MKIFGLLILMFLGGILLHALIGLIIIKLNRVNKNNFNFYEKKCHNRFMLSFIVGSEFMVNCFMPWVKY